MQKTVINSKVVYRDSLIRYIIGSWPKTDITLTLGLKQLRILSDANNGKPDEVSEPSKVLFGSLNKIGGTNCLQCSLAPCCQDSGFLLKSAEWLPYS